MGIYNINLLFPRFEDLLENPDPPVVIPDPDPEPEPDPTFVMTDIGSGRFTATGTDSEVVMINGTVYQLNSPTVTNNGNGTFTATSA